MSNVFNNYFTSTAEKTKSNIKFLPKHYTDYLSNINTNTFFLTTIDKNAIFLISSLDSNKSSDTNSIPVKDLKLLKNNISKQLSDIFNMSCMTGQFLSVLKIAKFAPIHKKQSKVDYTIDGQISRVFPAGGGGGSLTSQKFAHSPHQEKFPHSRLLPPPNVYFHSVTYSGRLGDQYTGFDTQTLAPKKHFPIFLFLFQLYFSKIYVEVAINDFTMYLIAFHNVSKWLRIQKW